MKQLFLLLTTVTLLFAGCKKDSSSSSGEVTLKYEIQSTTAFSTLTAGGGSFPAISVIYANETGQQQREEINTTTSTWSKTIQLTSTQRPIPIMFYVSGFTSSTSGTGVVRIYVNGVVKASQNVSITPGLGYGIFGGNIVHNLF
jgi:hypothetical protein